MTMFCVLVWMIGLSVVVNALDINKIDDGIIVTSGEDINIIEGEWNVLLTVHKTSLSYKMGLHDSLTDKATDLWNNVLKDQKVGTFFTVERKALLKAKIEMILNEGHQLRYNLTTTRERRGVLDFIGTGLNWAFGTATQAQVDQLQQAVVAARDSQRAVVHNVQELITVVNQTRLEEKDTRRKLATLSGAYDSFVTHENTRWQRHVEGTQLLMAEEYVDTLLWLDAAVWKDIENVDELQRSLRAGQLTEGLCPMTLIKTISDLAGQHGLRALPLEWYYENVPVTPLMIRDEIMTFGITLPFINTRLYQRYQITTFAVPMNDQGLRARVQVENDITLDTQDGYWFVPTLCVGHRPQLCRAGPKWKDSYPCERGLVTGHLPDREQCVIISSTTNKTTAQEISEGQFVVQTLGEDIKLACHGRDQEQATLIRGIYSFVVGEGCVLSGERWALHGLVRRYLMAEGRLLRSTIRPFSIHNYKLTLRRITKFTWIYL